MRGAVLTLLWLLTLAVAFHLGRTLSVDDPDAPPDLDPIGEAFSAVGERTPATPTLAPGPRAREPATDRGAGPGAGRSPGADVPAADEELGEFSWEGIEDPQEAMDRLMRHAAALLAKGKQGHLELLRFLSEHVVDNEELEQMLGPDETSARFMYPWIKFLVHREAQVLDLVETTYATMADDPAFFEDIDKDVVEIFTEGVAFILPGVVDEERLDRFRGLARRILDADESTQPDAIRKERSSIEGALTRFWMDPRTAEETLAQLQDGRLTGREALTALRRLSNEQKEALDLAAILEPAIRQGDYHAIAQLRRLPLSARDLAILDGALLEAGRAGQLHEWHVANYVRGTRRGAWPGPQPLIERGLAAGGACANAFALSLRRLDRAKGPDADYVRWVIDRHDLDEATATALRAAFALK